jgi:uncharacterized membrane protein YdjX (TVP38/TMEM64 family)
MWTEPAAVVNRSTIIKAIALALLLGAIVWLARATDVRGLLRGALFRVSEAGPWGPILFILTYVVACVAFMPAVLLTLGGGILFGVLWGTVYVTLGATLGASCAFLISRYLARDWVESRLASNLKFRVLNEAVEREGWKVVLLLRLSPMFPFVALNFIFGLTRIPLGQFFLATLIGIVPAIAMFAYLGRLIGDLAQLGHHPPLAAGTGWLVPVVGLVSAVVITLAIGRLARRALNQSMPTPPG